jgi:nucleoside-diphosphate-sugar epimerase
VFHLGARTDLGGRSLGDYSANTTGTKNLVAAIADTESVEHTIHASSRLVFDIAHQPAHDYDYRASTVYGQSKVEMEGIVRASPQSTSWTLVRPTSIWGPWFDVPYRDFFDAVRRGRFLKPAGVTIYKSFGYVGNAVHQLMAIAGTPDTSRGKVLWLCDYEPLELSQWADEIALGFGRRGPRTVGKSVLRFLANVGDAMARCGYSNPPITSFRLNNLLTTMVYDASRTEEIAGALPFNRLAGVTETIVWLRR